MTIYKDHPLKIYNSLSNEKEIFTPIQDGHVGMYVCGPTVYSNVHLGNVRTFLSFDIIYRYLLHLGYKVRYVRNITDVGHLVDDALRNRDSLIVYYKQQNPKDNSFLGFFYIFYSNLMRKFTIGITFV